MGLIGAKLASRDNALNFVRLLLAASVIVWHTYPVLGVDPGWPAWLVGAGAVNGFFAISGYLIAGSRMRLGFWKYLWKRFVRIYPGFWVALLATAFVFAPFAGVLTNTDYTVGAGINYVVQNATLWIGEQQIGGTLTTVPHPQVWNASLWTLFYEFAAYVLIGAALSVPYVRRHLAPVALITTVGLSVAAGLNVGSTWPGPLGLAAEAFRLWSFFAAGALVFALRDRVRATPIVGTVSGLALALTYVFGVDEWASQVPLALFLLWVGAVTPVRIGAKNDISYGMYIYAFPVQQMLVILLGAGTPPWLFMIAATACTVPFAWASWLLVEGPAMRLRFAPRRRDASAGASSQATRDPRRREPTR